MRTTATAPVSLQSRGEAASHSMKSFFEERAELLKKSSEGGQLTYRKNRGYSTGYGDRYEERTLVLVFLRCLRHGLHFLLSCNDAAGGGKLDDLVLSWSGEAGVSALFVQLKHKSEKKAIPESGVLELVKQYYNCYKKIKDSLAADSYALVLCTNRNLVTQKKGVVLELNLESVHGMKLLDSGGRLYALNPDNDDVKRAFDGDERFIRHFYLFCNQSDCESILDKIYEELQLVLGADKSCCKALCGNLCESMRAWMNTQGSDDNYTYYITSSWGSWLDIVDTYLKKEVTTCNSIVTKIKYSNVEALQAYIEGHNPAWIRPPGRKAAALTATKVHQMIFDERHIMVSVTCFTELEKKILCCWGRFCPWLVIVDENDGDKHSYNIPDRLREQAGPNRRLVIVSYKGGSSFMDTCKSEDIHNDSWSEFIDTSIKLNSDQHFCRLGDLCDTESLKAVLDGNPEALAALSQLSGPVRMGQDLNPLPENHIRRDLISRMRVNLEFFSSLGDKELCIMDEVSHQLLSNTVVLKNTVKFEELEKYLSVSDTFFPLFVVTSYIDCSAIEIINSKYADVRVYVLSHVDDEWLYVEKQSISLLNIVHGSNDRVIVEGKPGVGKSTMLLDMAWQLKGQQPSWWILRIDLSNYSKVFENCDSGVKATEDVLNGVVCNEKNLGIGLLEQSLLQHCLRQYPRIVCLVDGFDEICPDYADKCLQALQELAPGRGKLVVATRPSVTGQLEAALESLAHTVPAFSDKQLEEFHSRPLSEMGVTDKVRELLKIPLFSVMYAEILESGNAVEDIVSLYEAFFEKKFIRLYKEKLGVNLSLPGNRTRFQRDRMEHEKRLAFLAVSHLLPALEVPFIEKLTSEDREDLKKAGVIYKFISDEPVFIHRTFAEYFLAKWCFSEDADSRRVDVYRKALSDTSLEFFVESFDRMASKDRPLLTAVLNGSEIEVKSRLENGSVPTEGDTWGRNSLHLAAVYSHDSTTLRLLVRSLEVVRVSALSPAEETQGAVAAEATSEVDQKQRSAESVGVAGGSCVAEAAGGAGPPGVEELVRVDVPSQYEEAFHAVAVALGAPDVLLKWPPLRYAAERQCSRAVAALLEVGAQLRDVGTDIQSSPHSPEELWRVFKQGGYRVLFHHIAGKSNSRWTLQLGAENERFLEIKVAVSIIHREMSRRQYKAIICGANKNDNFVVAKLLSLKWMELIKTSASPALDLRQISSGACLLGEFIQVVLNGAELGSSPLQWMGTAGDYTILRNSAEEKLINAVVRGDVNSVQQQIKAVADVNALAYCGRSAIHVAAVADNVECIISLLSAGAEVNLKDTICKTPLHYAAEMGRLQSVKILLAAGADPIAKDSTFLTPLHLAARAGNAECVRVLAGAAADNLEVKNLGGFTALHSAAFRGEAECVKQLLAAGAHPSPVSNKMATPLHYAAQNGNAECVRLLVRAGAAVAAKDDRGIMSLHRAAMSGNPDCLKQVLKTGADVNEKDGEGRTPLHCAVQSGNPDCVRLLLDAKADVLAKDGKGDTPLHWAVVGRSPACVELLLENGADANARNNNGATPLHFAAQKDKAECVKLLLAGGAQISAVDDYLNTPLHCAAEKGNAECVRLLVEAGADVAARDDKGATALHWSARSGNPECVRNLLEAGADVQEKDGKGDTPLHWAAREGGPACITLLLEKGADVNARNKYRITPLHCAVQSGNPDCVRHLLEARADVHDKDGDGETPLHWAAREGSPACIRLLLKKGADVNARNNSGATALHCAAMSDNPDSVRHLLEAGADVQKKDAEGLTPLDWAKLAGSPACIRLLLEKRADVDERNSNGVTPLHFAAHSGDAERVKQLLEAGADPLAPDQLSVTPLHVAASMGHVVCFILLLYSAWVRYRTRQ